VSVQVRVVSRFRRRWVSGVLEKLSKSAPDVFLLLAVS
jgi:hypothetical protein